jgi:O-antigen ligase
MKIDNIYKILAGLNLFGFPLLVSILALFSINSTSYSIALRAIILGLSLWLLFKLLIDNKVKITKGIFWVPLTIFWIAYLIRLYIDTLINPSYALSRAVEEYWIWAVGACLIPMLGLLTYSRSDYVIKLDKICFFFVLVASCLTLVSGSTEYVKDDVVHDIGRLNLSSLNPISVGHLGGTLALLSVWFLLSKESLAWAIKLVLVSSIILGFYLILTSGSRGPLISVIISLIIYIALSGKSGYFRIIFAISFVTLLFYYLTLYIDSSGAYSILKRIESTFSGNDASFLGRQTSFSGAVEQFLDSPIFGDSIEEKITEFYPHNVILEAFMATGLLGGLAFLWFMAMAFRASMNIMKMNVANAWIAIIFLQYFVGAQFSGAIYISTIMWTFASLVFVASRFSHFHKLTSK